LRQRHQNRVDAADEHVHEKEHEVPVVEVAHAVIHPRAVVVHLLFPSHSIIRSFDRSAKTKQDKDEGHDDDDDDDDESVDRSDKDLKERNTLQTRLAACPASAI